MLNKTILVGNRVLHRSRKRTDEYVPLFPRDPGEILKEMVYEVSQIPEDGEPGPEFYKLLTQLTYKTINKDNATRY